jgi:CelD/BcsL family acetyltransferase involved in cellulose biosynthesis
VLDTSFPHIKGYYIALRKDSGEGFKAGLPTFYVRSCVLGHRLVAAPFATLFDPLVSNPDQASCLVEAVKTLAADLNVTSFEIRALAAGHLMKCHDLASCHFYKHHYLNLEIGPNALMKKFHRTCVRQRINRARSSNLKLKVGREEVDLQEFYRLFKITRRRVRRPVLPYRFFKNLWDVFGPSGQLELLLARKNSTTLGGLILFKFGKRVSAEFAASNKCFKSECPNHFLFWNAIKRSHRQGYRIFDFGRTAPDNQHLMDFKRRWGTQVIDLFQFYGTKQSVVTALQTSQDWRVRLSQAIIGWAPNCLQEFIGSAIYRHMG